MVDLLLGQKAGRGLCVTFESDFVELVHSLPRPPGGDGIFYVHTWSSHGMRTVPEVSATTHHPDPSSLQPTVPNATNLNPVHDAMPGNQPQTIQPDVQAHPTASFPQPPILPAQTQPVTIPPTEQAMPAISISQPPIQSTPTLYPIIAPSAQLHPAPSSLHPPIQPPTIAPVAPQMQADVAPLLRGSPAPSRPPLPDRRHKNHRVRYVFILAAATWLCQHNPFYAGCLLDLQAVEGHRVEGARQEAMDVDSPVEEDAVEVLSLEDMQHGVSLAADPNIRLGTGAEALGVAGRGTNVERQRHQRELRESRASLHFKMKRANGLAVSFFTREGIEALSFPCHYADGLNHWGYNRPTKLQLGMYFRNRIQGPYE